jgi:hypothetical protein
MSSNRPFSLVTNKGEDLEDVAKRYLLAVSTDSVVSCIIEVVGGAVGGTMRQESWHAGGERS